MHTPRPKWTHRLACQPSSRMDASDAVEALARITRMTEQNQISWAVTRNEKGTICGSRVGGQMVRLIQPWGREGYACVLGTFFTKEREPLGLCVVPVAGAQVPETAEVHAAIDRLAYAIERAEKIDCVRSGAAWLRTILTTYPDQEET